LIGNLIISAEVQILYLPGITTSYESKMWPLLGLYGLAKDTLDTLGGLCMKCHSNFAYLVELKEKHGEDAPLVE
jgi:hypothetical protein